MIGTDTEVSQNQRKVISLPNGSSKGEGQKEVTPEFMHRNSSLTILLNGSLHTRVIYHIFVVILLILLCDTVIYDLMEHGKIKIGASVFDGFGDICRGVKSWLLKILIAISFYPGLRIYAAVKEILKHFPVFSRIWSVVGILGVIALESMIILIPIWDHLALFFTAIVTSDMFRLVMKVHSTAVACAPRCVDGGKNLPSFKHYLYFLFAPTLAYRDEYPRSNKTRWSVVLFHFLEIIAIILYDVLLWEKFIIPYWFDYGKKIKVEAGTVVRGMFACMLPGIIICLCSFYCILHSLQNAFAEMLKFGDRLFYEEWWTSSQFSWFYRAWNRLVHIWLRDHIYRPLAPRLGSSVSTLIVFMISAVVHEVIMSLTLGFWYPVLLIQFGCIGVLLLPLTATSGRRFPNILNLLMWLLLFIGIGLLWSLYSMEYFARKNCPPSESDSFFIPKSWSCPEIVFKHN